MSDAKQACDCRDWSCGLPPCKGCNEDHGGCPGELCRDCFHESIWKQIEEHERENPGSFEKRCNEVAELLADKKRSAP